MTRILVRNTQINVLKRSMFSPSPKLVSITFTYASSSGIDFSDTLLTVLQESVFRSILPQIGLLYMKGNAIDCNCQMKLDHQHECVPYYLETVCREPKRLQGVSIDKLTLTASIMRIK
ncbi:hypothetical protein CEXT_347301 [Caerostris extrusa]|uniref:Uncharacterized protein n=1 Tax=Caerostris extrusa TaxID=172846 RepID=A0AAV4U1G3_CAEEX|nr:hypothetical protein CEXT_347301 [Caerostris extrusa]